MKGRCLLGRKVRWPGIHGRVTPRKGPARQGRYEQPELQLRPGMVTSCYEMPRFHRYLPSLSVILCLPSEQAVMLGRQGEILYLCGWNKKLFIGQENRNISDSLNAPSVLRPEHSLSLKHYYYIYIYQHRGKKLKKSSMSQLLRLSRRRETSQNKQ